VGRKPPPTIITESRSLAGALNNLAARYLVSITATNGQVGGHLRTDVAPNLVARQPVLYLGDYDWQGGQIETNTARVLQDIVGPLTGSAWRSPRTRRLGYRSSRSLTAATGPCATTTRWKPRRSVRASRARPQREWDIRIEEERHRSPQFGRPGADPAKLEAARVELAKGTGVLKTARLVGLGTGTVQRLKAGISVAA
jgi:hypothetical protein